MIRVIFILLLIVFTLRNIPSVASEEAFDLFKQGYVAVHEQCCISFDGCEHDKAYTLGAYIFVCSEYGYSYNYGDITIISDSRNFYMCIDDDQECYEGVLYRK